MLAEGAETEPANAVVDMERARRGWLIPVDEGPPAPRATTSPMSPALCWSQPRGARDVSSLPPPRQSGRVRAAPPRPARSRGQRGGDRLCHCARDSGTRSFRSEGPAEAARDPARLERPNERRLDVEEDLASEVRRGRLCSANCAVPANTETEVWHEHADPRRADTWLAREVREDQRAGSLACRSWRCCDRTR